MLYGTRFLYGQDFLSCLQNVQAASGTPPNLLFSGYQDFLPIEVQLTTHYRPFSKYGHLELCLSALLCLRALYRGQLCVTSSVKDKAVPLQAWSGPEGSRELRFPYFMTTAQDGGKVVSLTHRPTLPPGNTPGTHFGRPQNHSATGRVMSLKNYNDTIGNRTRDLPVCSVVP